MAVPEDYGEFISELIAATDQGLVDWAETAHEGCLQAAFSDFGLGLDSDDGDTVTVSIIGGDGHELDEFEVSRGEPEFYDLMRLHTEQLRKARGIPQAIEIMRSELRKRLEEHDRPF